MKLKYLCFLFFLLILSGCTLDYNLVIDENLILTEYITTEEENSVISTYSNSIEGFIYSNIFEYERDDDSSYYFFKKFKNDKSSRVIASYTYLDFNELKEKNKVFDSFFSNINISINESIIKLYFESKSSNELLQEDEINSPIFREANIIITLPFKVTNTNADVVQNNNYIWNFDSDNYEKSVILEFDSSKKQIRMIPTPYLVVIFIVIAILFFGFKLYRNYKKNSEF